MNYKKYFEILIKENERRKTEFPNNKVFSHNRESDYYTSKFVHEGVEYNFVISTPNSTKYGNFIGLIVEVQSKNNFFEELEKYQVIINEELGEDLIVEWKSKQESQNGDLWNIHTKLEANIEDENKWNEYAKWQIDTMIKFLEVFPRYTKQIKGIRMPKEKVTLKTKNIILYGAPGVGKTHNTNKLINLIDESKSEKEIFNAIKENKNETITLNDDLKSRVKFITFHQSFGYEDFIEGFRPNHEGNIKIEKGIFHNICTEAIKEENKDKNYYLVIDEINRGNISKIFGELITLIEDDKRDKIEVTLPYSKEPFKVPSNLFIIGTMNSTDKSIALIDIALRRRFTFLKMKPNEILVPDIAKSIFSQINQKISETIGEDYKIGHSYFMNISNEDDLNFVLEYKITPLLEEYFYGNKEQLDQVLEIIKG